MLSAPGTRIAGAIAVAAAAVWAFEMTTLAVIQPPTDMRTLSKVSPNKLVGRITAVDAGAKVVDVEIERSIDGAQFEPKARINASAVPEVMEHASRGKPVVIIVGRRKGGLIHLADTLLLADESPQGSPPTWAVNRKEVPWLAFPGPTAGLVQCLDDQKNGRFRMTSAFRHRMSTEYKEVMNLGGKPVFLAAGDVDGDKAADLLAGMPGGLKLHVNAAPEYPGIAFREATSQWGLSSVTGRLAAFGDANGDGKNDLLVDSTLYVNGGKSFARSPAVGGGGEFAGVIASALADATGDGRADALFLTKDGRFLMFENGGSTERAWSARPARALWRSDPADAAFAAVFGRWGADDREYVMVVRRDSVWRFPLDPEGGAPMDIERLAGQQAKGSGEAVFANVKCAVAIRLDARFGYTDFYAIIEPYPDLGLCNRGYGCYIWNTKLGDWRARTKGGKWGTTANVHPAVACAGDFSRRDGYEEFVFATEDGRLHVLDNDNWEYFTSGKGGGGKPQTP